MNDLISRNLAIHELSQLPSVETDYAQIKWERDIALQQLHELGYSLGEKIQHNNNDLISKKYIIKTLLEEKPYLSNDNDEYELGQLNQWESDKELIEAIAPSYDLEEQIYPLTITVDRYNGTYSGGKYIAWNFEPNEIHPDAWGDDTDCSEFWDFISTIPDYYYGVGDTISQAINNLYNKIHKDDLNGN